MAHPVFNFATTNFPKQFELISFTGEEGLSQLFRFTLELKVKIEDKIDLQKAVDDKAKLIVSYTEDKKSDYTIEGVISSFEEVYRTSNTHKFFRAIMVPPVWLQTQSLSYDIYTKTNVKKVLEEELRKDMEQDFLIATSATYPEKEFICQYSESNFNFVSRLAEHWGIYYYFNHEENGQMVFADDTNYEEIITRTIKLDESTNPASSFDTIRSLRRVVNNTVDGIVITDVNPELASTHIEGKAGEQDDNKSCIHLVAESVDTKDEADFIAGIRLQEYQCMGTVFTGTAGIPNLSPGFILKVSHGENKVTDMLIIQVQHRGANLDDTAALNENADPAFYECSFLAIPKDAHFRPKRNTPRPVAVSTSARVYSADDKKDIAQRDEKGRYQVVFDFLPKPKDNSNKHVSHWIRMAQSAARTNHHDIPLIPETEVKIGFSSGNPDRPYIMSALENSQSARVPVSNVNPHHATFITDGLLYNEAAKSTQSLTFTGLEKRDDLKMNDFTLLDQDGVPATGDEKLVDEIKGNQHIHRRFGDTYSFVDGNNYTYGREFSFHFGHDYNEYHADWSEVDKGDNYFSITKEMLYSTDRGNASKNDVEAVKQVGIANKTFGNKYNYHSGVESNWAFGKDQETIHKTFNYGGRYIENRCDTQDQRIDNFEDFQEKPKDQDLITKTIGNTFDLQQGKHFYVFEGDTTEKITGNLISVRNGNENLNTTGDLSHTRTGKQTLESEGDITCKVKGNISNELDGDKSEKTTGSETHEISGDAKTTTKGDATYEVKGKYEYKGSAGAKVKQSATTDIKLDNLNLNSSMANIEIKNLIEDISVAQTKAKSMMIDSKLIDIKSSLINQKGSLVMIG